MPLWVGMVAWPVVTPVAAFFLKPWPAVIDLQWVKRHWSHHSCSKNCSPVDLKFREDRLSTQNPELKNQLLLQSAGHRVSIECILCPNCTKFDTALPWALDTTHTNCEANKMNGSQDMQATDRQRFVELYRYYNSMLNIKYILHNTSFTKME